LLDLADSLRRVVPTHAPLEIAVRVGQCIVRLENFAYRDPVPDDALHVFLVGQALLKTCQKVFDPL
jgi:hypothetical protein